MNRSIFFRIERAVFAVHLLGVIVSTKRLCGRGSWPYNLASVLCAMRLVKDPVPAVTATNPRTCHAVSCCALRRQAQRNPGANISPKFPGPIGRRSDEAQASLHRGLPGRSANTRNGMTSTRIRSVTGGDRILHQAHGAQHRPRRLYGQLRRPQDGSCSL